MGSVCVLSCLHDDYWFVEQALGSAAKAGPIFALVSRLSWNGPAGDWKLCARAAEAAGAEVILGDWPDESSHRRAALALAKERGFQYAIIPDGDEALSEPLLKTLINLAEAGVASRVHCHMDTYWKSARYVIRPRERLTPAIMLAVNEVEHVYIREYQGGRSLVLDPEFGVLHHLSYAGPDERIQRKLATWSHRDEVQPDWYRRVWLGWDRDRAMRDLHPTHPRAYGFTERIDIPPELQGVWDERSVAADPDVPANWPSISVVIPLHGGGQDIALCLASLETCRDLLHETIVVDDVSPDDAPEAVREHPWVKLVANERNLGFAGTCNRGYAESTGSIVLFLNSDTYVPRSGLIRLIETLLTSGSIAASGPKSNHAGYYQYTDATYTSIQGIDLFARDFSAREEFDIEVEMLVGFCLAVRRSVLEEIGLFDERFGIGLFEDTDLCYRMQRAGYKLALSNRAFVHHKGSSSLPRKVNSVLSLLGENRIKFEEKWRRDIELGFASHLPGLPERSGKIEFNPGRSPETVEAAVAWMRDEADISLCMIVRNEERVIGDCLKSVTPFFKQVVIVDTGSTDRTVDICRAHGAEVYEIQWPDSFADARNESLKYAKGKWIFWVDADDTMNFSTGELVLQAALRAPKEVAGFIVPVQFVEDGPGAGTRVDHVKLIRNVPGLQFEGRIHEQILSSLSPHGGIARIPGAYVLHSGYDTSDAGQRKKRDRDWYLLDLDLQERPDHPFVLFNCGMTAHFCGEQEKAVAFLERSLQVSQPHESHVRKTYALLCQSHKALERFDEALLTAERGLAVVGYDPELHFLRGMLLANAGRFQEAIQAYDQIEPHLPDHYSSFDIAILTHKKDFNCAAAWLATGNYLRAREGFMRAMEQSPHWPPPVFALFDAALDHGDLQTANRMLAQAQRLEGPSENWTRMGIRLTCANGGETEIEGFLRSACNQYPRAIGPALELCRLLLQTERVEEAVPMLIGLQEAGVAEAAFYLGVQANRAGQFDHARMWMARSAVLNPGHGETLHQLKGLKEITDAEFSPVLLEIGSRDKEKIKGPYLGDLGAPTLNYSVCIVTYNSASTIERCLRSVLASLPEGSEIRVLDNASKDSTWAILERMASEFPHLKVELSDSNTGYSKGMNHCLRKTKGRYLVALNPDTEVFPNWLQKMASRMADNVAAVGPFADNVGGDQFVGHCLPHGLHPPVHELPTFLSLANEGRSVAAKMLMGFCTMYCRDALNQTGLLEEGAFLGADDLEMSWRLRALGHSLAIAEDVFISHQASVSFDSLPTEERNSKVLESDLMVLQKLKTFYAPDPLPTSIELWGSDIFQPVMDMEPSNVQ